MGDCRRHYDQGTAQVHLRKTRMPRACTYYVFALGNEFLGKAKQALDERTGNIIDEAHRRLPGPCLDNFVGHEVVSVEEAKANRTRDLDVTNSLPPPFRALVLDDPDWVEKRRRARCVSGDHTAADHGIDVNQIDMCS